MIVPIFPLRKQSILWKRGSPPQSLMRKMMHLCPTFIASTFGKNIFSSKMFCKSSFIDRELDTFLCVILYQIEKRQFYVVFVKLLLQESGSCWYQNI